MKGPKEIKGGDAYDDILLLTVGDVLIIGAARDADGPFPQSLVFPTSSGAPSTDARRCCSLSLVRRAFSYCQCWHDHFLNRGFILRYGPASSDLV